MNDTSKGYIAFSIHGTNQFIVATKEFNTYELRLAQQDEFVPANLQGTMRRVQSRRPNYRASDGIKLEWSGLTSTKTKKPYTSPIAVLRRFNQLAAAGWTVVGKDAFAKRHLGGSRRPR